MLEPSYKDEELLTGSDKYRLETRDVDGALPSGCYEVFFSAFV